MDTMNTEYAQAYIDIINGNGQTKTIYSSEDAIDSIAIRTGCYDGNAMGVGSVYEVQCSIVMKETEGITAGTELVIAYNIGGKGWERFGTFYVSQTPEYSGGKMTVEAHGEISISGGKTYTNQDFYRLDKITTVGYVLDSLMGYGITVNYDKTSAFASWQIAAPGYDDDSQENKWKSERICVKEVLAGIAIMYGGNMVERNGTIYLTPKNGGEGGNFSVDDCTSYQCSRESYGIESIALSNLPWVEMKITDMDNPGQILERFILYQGTERETRNILVSQADTGANIKYQQQIECDWIGYSMSYAGGCFVQGDLVYKTGTFTFPGFNEKLYAGNVINIYLDENKFIPFVIGEMTLNWDGGFTTEISCSCSVDTVTGICESSTSSTAVAAGNSASALMQYNNTIYADVLLANVAEISEAFIGKLTSDEIFAEKLTAGEAFIENLTASEAFIEKLTANSAFVETLSSDQIFVQELTAGEVFTESLTANEAFVEKMKAKVINADTIEAAVASVGYLTAEKADMQYAKIDFTNVGEGVITNALIANAEISFEKVDNSFVRSLNADHAFIEGLRASTASFGYLNAESADIRYAAINFANIDTANIDTAKIGLLFNEVGLIDRATIVDGHVTGFLDSVQINANSITSGEIATDRLIIRGSTNSVVYEINNITGALQAASVDTLNGEVITKRTISADKLIAKSITANEIDVQNLFAQNIVASGTITGATLYGTHAEITSGKIGAFSISDESLIYNGSSPYRTVVISDMGVSVGYDYALTKTAITSGDIKVSSADDLYAVLGNRNRGNALGAKAVSLLFEHGVNASYSGPSGNKSGKQYRSAELSIAGIEVKNYTNWNDGSVSYNGAGFDIQASVLGLRADAGFSSDTAIHGEGNLKISAQKNVKIDRPLECTGGIVANAYTSTGSMELYHPEGTPYIDFHHGAYGTEGTDYTSRIIEYEKGTLTFESNLLMSGTITTAASKYKDDGITCALNLRNSNIIGVNGIYTADLAEEASEGLNFYRTASSVDSVFANGGKLYFAPGRSLGTVIYPGGSYRIPGRKYGTMTAVNGSLRSESFVWVDNDNHGQLHAVLTNVTVSAAYTWTALLNTSVYPSGLTHGQIQVTDGGAGVSGTERAAARMQSNVAITSPVTFSGKQVIIDIFW